MFHFSSGCVSIRIVEIIESFRLEKAIVLITLVEKTLSQVSLQHLENTWIVIWKSFFFFLESLAVEYNTTLKCQ